MTMKELEVLSIKTVWLESQLSLKNMSAKEEQFLKLYTQIVEKGEQQGWTVEQTVAAVENILPQKQEWKWATHTIHKKRWNRSYEISVVFLSFLQ